MNNELIIKGILGIQGVDVIHIEGGFGTDKKGLLAKNAADIHQQPLFKINERINTNIALFDYGIDIIDLKNEYANILKEKGIITQNCINSSKNIYMLSETGYIKLSSILKNPNMAEAVLKEYFNSENLYIPMYTKEYKFYELLNETLEVFKINGVSQYTVLNYKIDYYIPSLNIAVEYDENGHNHYSKIRHEDRQKEIEKELGCRFIRVTDEYSINKAVAITLKELGFKLC